LRAFLVLLALIERQRVAGRIVDREDPAAPVLLAEGFDDLNSGTLETLEGRVDVTGQLDVVTSGSPNVSSIKVLPSKSRSA
jgi:hypothetical protein